MKAHAMLVASLLLALSISTFNISDGSPTRTVSPLDDPQMHPIGFFRGILPNPAGVEDPSQTYRTVTPFTQFVPVRGAPTPFWNLSKDLNGTWGDANVRDRVRGNGMFPLVMMSFMDADGNLATPPGLKGATLSDPEWRAAYRKAALDIVNITRPAYLSLGDEVNLWYESHGSGTGDPNGFQNYVSLYSSIHDGIQVISPATVVFCTFAREVVQEGGEADMGVLSMFDLDKLDIIVLTSHPAAVSGIDAVEDIPDDYYSAIPGLTGRPMGLCDISWPSFSSFGGEASQSRFISDAVGRLTRDRGLDLRLITWSHLTDRGIDDRSGLRYANGTEKTSLDTWRMDSAPYYIKENRTIDLYEDFGTFGYDLNRTFRDPDVWDALTFKVRNETGVYTDHRNFTLLGAAIVGHTLVLTSEPDREGKVQIMVLATDHDGASTWAILQVQVLPVNDGPRFAFPFGTLEFLEDHSLYVQVSYYVLDPDDDFGSLTVKAGGAHDLSVVVQGEYVRIMTAVPDWYGEDHVVISVTDPSGSSVTSNITVHVVPVNDPPVIGLPDHIEMAEDGNVSIDLKVGCSDVDGDQLNWSFSVLAGEIDVKVAGDNMTVLPSPEWSGQALFEANLTDGLDHDTLVINVTVVEENDPPAIDAPVPIRMVEDHMTFYNVSELRPRDVEGTVLSWQVLNYTPILRSVTFLQNGTMRIHPGTDDFGTGTINAILRDGGGAQLMVSFPVTVAPVNDPPFMITRTNVTYKVTEGSSLSIDLKAPPFVLYDVESPDPDLTVVVNSTLCTVDGMTIVVTVPNGTAIDSFIVGILVKDPEGAQSDIVSISIEVKHPAERYRLSIDRIENGTVKGTCAILAYGAPYQTVWVVFTDGISLRMVETPPGNGKYVLLLQGGPWAEGDTVSFHLSAEEGGPNDTPYDDYSFTFRAPVEISVDHEPPLLMYVLPLALAALLAASLVIVIIRRGSKRGPQPSSPEE